MKKLDPLPKSDDEYWEESTEKYVSNPVKVFICPTHRKDNWMGHDGYKENGDGTVSCLVCGWGFKRPGYIRILDGKVVDLRDK